MPHEYQIEASNGGVYKVEAADDAQAERMGAFIEEQIKAGNPGIKDVELPDQGIRKEYQVEESSTEAPQGDGGKSFLDTGFGLAGRNLMRGVGAIPGLIFDQVSDSPGVTDKAINHIADAMGMRDARVGEEGYADRMVGAGFQGLGGAAAMGAGGMTAPGLEAASGATGSMAGQHTAEMGGSPGEQLVASIMGGAVPGLARSGAAMGVRGAMRGNDPGPMREALRTFDAAGTFPSVAQATGGDKANATEAFLSQLFGSSGIVRKANEAKETAIGDTLAGKADGLVNLPSNEAMGAKIGDDAENVWMKDQRKSMDAKYDKFYQMVPGSTVVPVGKFGTTLDELTSHIAGAKNLSENSFLNPDRNNLLGVVTDLKKDLAANNGAGLPLEAVKNIRTRVGKLLEDATFDSNRSTGDLKRIYGSLTETMKDAAGPEGSASRIAFDEANAATKDYHATLDLIKPVLERNGGPERVFTAALGGMKEGGTVLRNVYKVLTPEGREAMTAAIMKRAATPAASDPDTFDMVKWAANYANMNPEAKKVVFGSLGANYKTDLDAIAKTVQTIAKQRAEYGVATSAKEGKLGVQGIIGTLLFAPASLAAGAAGGTGAGAAAATALAATGTTAILGARKLAKWMTNPKTVHFLAESTKLPKEQLPIFINSVAQQATRDADPDMKELAEYLKAQEEPK